MNHVEASEAPASISTRISFSIPRMESANLGSRERRRNVRKQSAAIYRGRDSQTHAGEQRACLPEGWKTAASQTRDNLGATQPAAEQFSRCSRVPGDPCCRLLLEHRVACTASQDHFHQPLCFLFLSAHTLVIMRADALFPGLIQFIPST